MQRGKPSTLVLSRLDPSLTVSRAPGPGPITKHDWAPLGQKWLANRKVIFHTDSAKAYKLKLPNVIHDSVVHQKKRVKKHGKWQWTKPCFAKLKAHKLPTGKRLKVKCGTQHIDRCWKFIKERRAKGAHVRAGSISLNRKIRSAQYEYWHVPACVFFVECISINHVCLLLHLFSCKWTLFPLITSGASVVCHPCKAEKRWTFQGG